MIKKYLILTFILLYSIPAYSISSYKAIYDLYAVSNHMGGMGGGHYTAYGLNSRNGKWYEFDDTRTSEVNAQDVVTAKAYVLFYCRRSVMERINKQRIEIAEQG